MEKKPVYFYISIVACVLSVIAFGLTFTTLGVYALISSILLGLASLSFAVTQQKKSNFRQVKYVKITAYCVLAAEILFFIGGLIYSALV